MVDSVATFTSPQARTEALGRLDAAAGQLARARRGIRRSLTLKLARVVPVARTYSGGVRTLADSALEATQIARDLLTRINDVAAQHPLVNGTVPLDAMSELATEFGKSATAVAELRRPPSGLWGALGDASAEFRRIQVDAPDRLRGAAQVLAAGRGFLGGSGARTYVVAGQNNAEMRDQGMVLSYAVISADKGKVAVARNGRITDLAVTAPVDVPLPAGTTSTFTDAPRFQWQNVNATADFSLSGRLMAALYERAASAPVDGVIAVDVPGLSRLLTVVGPVTVPGLPEPLTAENAARLLLHDLYAGLPPAAVGSGQDARYERLNDAVNAVLAKIRDGSYDMAGLGVALADAARGGHFRLFSKNAAEQIAFEQRGLSGGPAVVAPERTFHVAVQNGTATKLDYFVKPRVEMAVGIDRDGTATVRTKVIVANTAPADSAPSYQVGPDGASSTRPGQYVARVGLWGPRGADQPSSVRESGLELTQQIAPVAPAKEETVEFVTVIRNAVRDGRLVLRLVPQARLEPLALAVTLDAPGWDVSGNRRIARVWDRTVTFTWRLHD